MYGFPYSKLDMLLLFAEGWLQAAAPHLLLLALVVTVVALVRRRPAALPPI